MKKIPTKKALGQLSSRANPAAIVSGVTEVLSAYKGYRIVKLQEKTKIKQIEAERDKTIQAIQAQRDLMLDYFERAFAERAQTLERSFVMLDQAIQHDNSEAMNVALTLIVNTIQTSPLADFASFTKALQDPKQQFTF